jgi:hypothetical protein
MRLPSTSISIVVLSATTIYLSSNLLSAVAGKGAAPDSCRCTADFEHFYARRALQEQPQSQLDEERSLLFKNHGYDYKGYYIDDDGYYVVEGVKVLPDDDPACNGSKDIRSGAKADKAAAKPYKRDGILARVFGHGRSLLSDNEIDEDEEHEETVDVDEEEDVETQQRALMGMMSSKGYYQYSYDDDGYYGNGKVRYYV